MLNVRSLFVIPCPKGFTGASIAAVNIASGLAKLGVDVRIVTTPPPSGHLGVLARAVKHGVKVYLVKGAPSPLYWPLLLLASAAVIVRLKPTIIHLHLPKLAPLALMAKPLGSVVVATLEGDPDHELMSASPLHRAIVGALWRLLMKASEVICPCSEWLAKTIAAKWPQVTDKLRPIPNPIDYEWFSRARGDGVREELGVEGVMVLTAARLDRVKGVDVLVKASIKLAEMGVKATFIVAGEGPLKEELSKLIEETKAPVKLVGHRGDVNRLMAACDIVVLPSIYEPFGMPAAEAGALGKPVVASNVGGLKEIVLNGVTGILVTPGDEHELAKAIFRLASNRELRAKMGVRARRHVKERFSLEVIAVKVLKTYLETLKNITSKPH